MNEIVEFLYVGDKVRTVVIDNNPWFVAKDVCDILEVGNPSQALKRLDNDEKNTIILNEGIGNPNKSIVNESGLYQLILGSRKSEAKEFKRWITHEVIPAIRKHGMYATDEMLDQLITSPELVIGIATKLKEEKEARLKAEQQVQQLEIKVAEDAPKVLVHDKIIETKGLMLISEAAKICDIGPRHLFDFLREHKIIMDDKENTPYQDYIDRGYFEVKLRLFQVKGMPYSRNYTHITPKGIVWIKKRLTGVAA
jgi:prophage antirepressor-like protein